MKLRNVLSLSAIAMLPLLTGAQGCAGDDAATSQNTDNTTSVDHSNRGKWAVDMAKVDALYGTSSEYFLGLTSEEAGLQAGLPPVWDLTAKRLPNGEIVEETGTEVAVIDRQGNKVDPTGYVNIIPMLKDTDPNNQVHIKQFMKNGDVLVYVHPEQTGARGAMERRASHVGMHYEYTTEDGREMLHHIDNPNSYGPIYNHRPSRHMPFQVFRFKPKASDGISAPPPSDTAVTVEGVPFSAAQATAVLALVNEGDISSKEARKALHQKLDIDLHLRADAAGHIIQYRYHNGDIASVEVLSLIPRVGPVTLKDLRDQSPVADAPAVDATPISAEDAEAYASNARNWAMITNDLSPFAGFFDLRLQSLGDLPNFANAAISGQDIPSVYCSGLAYVNMNLGINYPLNQAALGPDMWSAFQGSTYEFSDANGSVSADALMDTANLRGLNRLVFEPYGATDILNAWIENYWGSIPLEMQLGIFQTPDFQQSVVQGFSQLEWSDNQSDEKQSSGEFKPGTVDNVKRWAAAYGRGADATAEYLANDAQLAEAYASTGMPVEGMTPMDILQVVEKATVATRFVPPQIWMDHADKDDSSLVYVGTVLNCEILTAVDGSDEDPCASAGGGVTTWSEGASDTSTYPHFAIANGGEITHRRFDVVGPANWGPDSMINVRLTHGDVGDVRFLAHVPSTWDGHVTADLNYGDYGAWCKEQLTEGKSCAAPTGILLQANVSGVADDETYSWRLGDICQFSADGTTATCPMASLEGGTFADLGAQEISTQADGGHVTVTFADLGNTSSAELENCAACIESGGQANQIKVTFNAPAGATDGGDTDPPVAGGDNECTAQLCSEEDGMAPSGCYCDSVCFDANGDPEQLAESECCDNFVAMCNG
jgi:hypothetical protein